MSCIKGQAVVKTFTEVPKMPSYLLIYYEISFEVILQTAWFINLPGMFFLPQFKLSSLAIFSQNWAKKSRSCDYNLSRSWKFLWKSTCGKNLTHNKLHIFLIDWCTIFTKLIIDQISRFNTLSVHSLSTQDRAERHAFWSQFLLFFSPFLFPP